MKKVVDMFLMGAFIIILIFLIFPVLLSAGFNINIGYKGMGLIVLMGAIPFMLHHFRFFRSGGKS